MKKFTTLIIFIAIFGFSTVAMSFQAAPNLGSNVQVNATVNYTNNSGTQLGTNSNILNLKVMGFYYFQSNRTESTFAIGSTSVNMLRNILNLGNDSTTFNLRVFLDPIAHSEKLHSISYNIYHSYTDPTPVYTVPKIIILPANSTSYDLTDITLKPGEYLQVIGNVDSLAGFTSVGANEKLVLKFEILSGTGLHKNYDTNTGVFSPAALTGTQLQFGAYNTTTTTKFAIGSPVNPILIINPVTNVRHGLSGDDVKFQFIFNVSSDFRSKGRTIEGHLATPVDLFGGRVFDFTNAKISLVTDKNDNDLGTGGVTLDLSSLPNFMGIDIRGDTNLQTAAYVGKTIKVTISGLKVSGKRAGVFYPFTYFLFKGTPNRATLGPTPLSTYTIDRVLSFSINPTSKTIPSAPQDLEFNTGTYTLTNTGTVPLAFTTALGAATVSNEQTIYTDTHNSIEGTTLLVGDSMQVDILLNTKNLRITGIPQTEHVIFNGSNLSDTATPIDLPIILQTVGSLANPTVTVIGKGDLSTNRQSILFGDDNIIRVDIKNNDSVDQTFNLTTGFLGSIASTTPYASKMDYHTTYVNGLILPTSGGLPQVTIKANQTVEYYIHYIPLTGYKAGNGDMNLTVVNVSDATKKATTTDYWNMPVQTALGIHKHADATSQSVSDLKHTVLDDVILYNNDPSITNASTYSVTLENATSYAGIAGFKVYLFRDTNHNGKYDPGVDHLTTTLTPTAATYSVDAYAGTIPGTPMPIYSGIQLVYDAADKDLLLNKQVVITFAFNTQARITNDLTRFPEYFAVVKDNIIFNGQGDILSIKHYQKTLTTCSSSKPVTDATSENALGLSPNKCVLYTIKVSPITPAPIGDIDVAEDLDNYLEIQTPTANFRIVDVNGGVTANESSEFTVSYNPTDNKEHIILKSGSTYQLLQNHKLNITFQVQMKKH